MRARAIVIVLVVAAISACARSPENIAPAYVSDVPYMSWSCRDLSEESLRLNAALVTASEHQEEARSSDTVGVLLLGLPVASLSGENVAPQIARLKGEIDAVRKATMKSDCETKLAAAQKNGASSDASQPWQEAEVLGFELASYYYKDVALANWKSYKDRYPILETAEPHALPRTTEDGEQRYVLYGIVDDRMSADDICTQIRLNDEYCEVVDLSTRDLEG